jgi:glycosyltransferase involved in cell wall biosynthesis
VAGYLAAEHKAYLAGIEARVREWGLEAELRYHGSLERAEKIAFLRTIDVLSVPSPYAEPKGLYLLEAMACGVPVVAPRHGAFPEMLDRTGGGLLFEPNDPSSLAGRVLALADDQARAAELGRRGAAGVRRHYTVGRMAERALEVYEHVAHPAARPAPVMAEA